MKQHEDESYNTMKKAASLLAEECELEKRLHGSTPRHKALSLGCGALCEVIDNIDRNNGRFIQVTVRPKAVSKWRAVIRKLTSGTDQEAPGDA